MKAKTIKGKVTWQTLGTGFWGIIDDNGGEWLPVNMPEQLKQDGKIVKVTIKETTGSSSVFMWGTPVKVISFHT